MNRCTYISQIIHSKPQQKKVEHWEERYVQITVLLSWSPTSPVHIEICDRCPDFIIIVIFIIIIIINNAGVGQ